MLLSWNYIWGICSGIFAIVFLVLGVVFGKNDTVIDVEPLVWIPSNDDLNYSFHETLVKLINESQESIYIFTQCFDKQISNDLIDILKSRHDNGIDIRLISKSNLSYDFLNFVNISSYKLTSDFFVFDEEKILFICESFSDGWNPITILFKNCKSIAKDVLAFYLLVQKIGEGKINDQTSSHWAHDLLVTENYLNPHTYQSGTIFFTQSLSKKIPPVRDIINETLTHITTIKLNYIKLITSGFVQQYGNQSMFYIQNELMKNGLSYSMYVENC
ncbi:hypothetical protein TRFO_19910 [Tritrichomonas foetus]|uniref:Uncharacterized protein n=1 Tax=Tritrichomonas foetus TaxID=1144522 RepID=A0A1J4KH87_9EUKA|nr:hypothetical protein TRFO_19910 [Tritrichomonas foetus]|eukprot:OHT10767.1 hypothetical protein TRFO_19910 [Tritrichomonas foetus]